MKKKIFLFAVSICLFGIPCKANTNADLIFEIAQNEQVGILIIYASGCGNCDQQIHEMERFFQETKWKTFTMVDINMDNNKNIYQPDQIENIIKTYQVDTVPETWLLHKNGKKKLIGYEYTPIEIIKERIKEAYISW